MFFGSMVESDESNDVIIHDLNVEQFKWLKAYVYHCEDDAQISADNVISILEMSDKYMIQHLTNLCIKYICLFYMKIKPMKSLYLF